MPSPRRARATSVSRLVPVKAANLRECEATPAAPRSCAKPAMDEFRLDWERVSRCGTSEAVLCEPKSAAQIDAIIAHAKALERRLLLTRLGPRKLARLSAASREALDYDEATRTAILGKLPAPS